MHEGSPRSPRPGPASRPGATVDGVADAVSGLTEAGYRNAAHTTTSTGTSIGSVYHRMYPPNDGICTPAASAIDFTMKFGPLPMYVAAPKKTAPRDIASR